MNNNMGENAYTRLLDIFSGIHRNVINILLRNALKRKANVLEG